MLSKKAQYSILALVKLAKEFENGPVLISNISRTENIPKKFLEAILIDLKQLGILGSKKGKGGGYFLVKKPEEINLAEIIRHVDGAIALIPCVTYKFYQPCQHCKDEATCGIRSIIKDIRDETVNMLKKIKLSDILTREEELVKNQNKKINKINYLLFL
jgi:Rrf2 family protein